MLQKEKSKPAYYPAAVTETPSPIPYQAPPDSEDPTRRLRLDLIRVVKFGSSTLGSVEMFFEKASVPSAQLFRKST